MAIKIKDKNLPASIFKNRVVKTNQSVGNIPNNANNISKLIAESNKSLEVRVNYTLFQNEILAVGTTDIDATNLSNVAVQIITSSEEGAGVKMPAPVPNMIIKLVNKSANTINVYSDNSTIDNGANITLASNSSVTLLGENSTNWINIY